MGSRGSWGYMSEHSIWFGRSDTDDFLEDVELKQRLEG